MKVMADRVREWPSPLALCHYGPKQYFLYLKLHEVICENNSLVSDPNFFPQWAQKHLKTLWERRECRHHTIPFIPFDSFSRPPAQNVPFLLHSETYPPRSSTYTDRWREMSWVTSF